MALLLLASVVWLGTHHWNVREALDDLHDSGTPISTGFAHSGVQTYSTASEVLKTLQVRADGDETGYSRTLFGDAWADVDRNGCDTRNDILARDLTELERQNNCKVMAGKLVDPYTAQTIEFKRGAKTSQMIPIDHVVALSNAWKTGATLLSESQRRELANDPLNLQSTDNTANTEKSDADASQWLPQAGYQCEYVARQISVKAAYHLWVSPAEKKSMEQVLVSCPDQVAYRSKLAG
ncbi:MAG: HNH endonuclease family protein [Rothia sp. (in: high G+C Gram-positive bacteria)]|nr:HNH endonuclease family protein [Rothia sp. (in: high G+C Gram-positive bacteria)]